MLTSFKIKLVLTENEMDLVKAIKRHYAQSDNVVTDIDIQTIFTLGLRALHEQCQRLDKEFGQSRFV